VSRTHVYVISDPNVSFGEVAEVIGIAARQADYVAIVTPSVMKRATYQGEACLPSEHGKDSCLHANLPGDYIAHPPRR